MDLIQHLGSFFPSCLTLFCMKKIKKSVCFARHCNNIPLDILKPIFNLIVSSNLKFLSLVPCQNAVAFEGFLRLNLDADQIPFVQFQPWKFQFHNCWQRHLPAVLQLVSLHFRHLFPQYYRQFLANPWNQLCEVHIKFSSYCCTPLPKF